MRVQTILTELWSEGVHIRLTQDGQSLAVPAGRLTPEQRATVLAHKPELLALLRNAHTTTVQLVAAAKRACDHWGDSPTAREQMRQDVASTPPHLRADLLQHFQDTYGPSGAREEHP